jgi:hypothetical protein
MTNNCLLFNGSSDYVGCGNNGILDLAQAVTISVWVKPIEINKFHTIVSKGNDEAYNLRIRDTNVVQFYIKQGDGGTPTATTTDTVSANQWYHLAGTYDGTTLKTYINGELKATTTDAGTISTTTDILRIGSRTDGWESGFVKGYIDDVVIFNRAATVAELKEVYYSGLDNLYLSGRMTEEEYNISKK